MSEKNTKNPEEVYEMEPEYDFSGAVRGRFYRPQKVSTTIRLDDDVILFFKKKAGEEKTGYQSLLNAALREYISLHRR
jgi:uncharacterized protein (DUF4415 family)